MSRFSFTGRMVQGYAHEARGSIDKTTKKPKLNQDGSERKSFFLAIAIAKNPAQRFVVPGTPDYESQRALIDGDARASWPQFFGTRPQGLQFDASLPLDCTNPKFANKIMDGDGFDENGQPNSKKEGWAGCWIVKVGNGFAPKCYEWENGWQELGPHSARKIKCGDYITVSGECVSNKSSDSPGMYMNFDTVSFEKEGASIEQGQSVDPNAALGMRGPNAGAGNAGAASSGGGAAGTTHSATASQEYSGYRETAVAAPPPDDDDDEPQMTAAATTTYAAYIAAGWTDEKLRKKGLMV